MSLELWPLNGSINAQVDMGQRWNDVDRLKPNDSEKILSQCHFVDHKSHMV
jgi:hypothetical protein